LGNEFTAMRLDTKERDKLAEDVLTLMHDSTTGSTALLRGSLAEQTADQYSDIDLLWEVPDDRFKMCVEGLRALLSKLHPVASVRSDPEFQNSDKRRVLFARVSGVPLFWRVDVEVFAKSIHRDPHYDAGNPNAQGTDWSLTESALMNAVAAVKAVLRNREDEAHQLLLRACQRVGLDLPSDRSVRELILQLSAEIRNMDPPIRDLSDSVIQLAEEALGTGAGL